MNEPKPMNEHCRLEHSDWNYLERSEDELCPVCRGEQMATERIIKLLEEHAEQEFADNYARDDGTYHEDVCNLCAKWNGLGVAIALIKGEK